MAIIQCCDICEKPISGLYTDANGKTWRSISFQQKRYRRKMFFMFDSWTEYLSICGRCRAQLAKLELLEKEE